MFKIQTPATAANKGSCFDCVGMAFQLYNTLWLETAEKPHIEVRRQEAGEAIPTDENNLIYKTIRFFFETIGRTMPGIHMIQEDQIPLTRGLGSSAACVVSGLLGANALSGAQLSHEDLLQMAARLEGHPDNAAPAFLGGVVVGAMENGILSYCRLETPDLTKLRFAMMIPNFPLSTEMARQTLPEMYSREDAVYNASRTALLTAALTSGRFDLLKTAMADRLHQPYRQKMIPGMKEIIEECEKSGALSVFLSGAGPTLAAVTDNENFAPELPDNWTLRWLTPDMRGAVITAESY
ncbi:MAG: homoserine kinase [Clostridiales bacterium]|nr:homoserine kinase [Clostridiales bacterium]